MADALLDMLRAMRLTGGIFLDGAFTAPWCLSVKVGPDDCAPFTPVPRHIIAYHYVAAGRCVVTVDGQPPLPVARGEIVMLPRNDAHLLGSSANQRPVRVTHLIRRAPDGRLGRIVHGGGGEACNVLCGFLGNDLPCNAFVALLPSVLKISVADCASADWIESSFRYAAMELAEGRDTATAMLARLAELMFMEAVRRHIAAQPPAANAWAAGMRDPVIGRALGMLHRQIARRWTTEALARELALSRSSFAARFTRLIGQPPMRYLAHQRMQQAMVQLRDSADPIARIAHDVGYDSEAAFNRAFRRVHGIPPAAWRRAQSIAQD